MNELYNAVISPEALVVAVIGVVIGAGIFVIWRAVRNRIRSLEANGLTTSEVGAKLSELSKLQSELTGRMQTMAEIFANRQIDLTRTLGERIDVLSNRVGSSIGDSRQQTQESLANLQERLGIVDQAQKNIIELSQGVISLQGILSNTKARGLFGQAQMEMIISDGLAKGSYAFQAGLSNGARPDCLVQMPNDAPPLVIDAKFPLESFQRFNQSKTGEERKNSVRDVLTAMRKHIDSIADKYLIPGETQDSAFMFIPSESLFIELHASFTTAIEHANRARIIVVSPSLLRLSIQVMQSLLKDVKIREQAHQIHTEVDKITKEVNRLCSRVAALQKHFAYAQQDIEKILLTSNKIVRRSARIEALEFNADEST